MASAQLSLNNVSIGFGDGKVLSQINLEIAKGETVVLIGPSGKGKTLALKLLAGLIAPDQGQVLIEGKNLLRIPSHERIEILLKMGMLFQKNALFDSLTVGNNIAFPLREKTKLKENEIQEKVSYFLEAVGLLPARALYPDEISGGMQKRLGIARALALDPEIILYDDPTAGLDPITSRKIIELILQLKKERGSTLVAVTNDMARAYQLADRIVMVVDQQLIVTGTREETLNHKDERVAQFIRGRLDGPLTEQ